MTDSRLFRDPPHCSFSMSRRPVKVRAAAWCLALFIFLPAMLPGCKCNRKETSGGDSDERGAPTEVREGWRNATEATHECGARVAVPEGRYLYSPDTRLQEIPVPPVLNKVQLVSPVLCFESDAGVVFEQKTPVDLPAGQAGDDAVVLVWSRLGMWIPLPSEPVKLAGGEPGRRVIVDREPTPWLFVVARASEAPAPPAGTDDGPDLIRMEQLRWTDKETLRKEIQQRQPRRGVAFLPPAEENGFYFYSTDDSETDLATHLSRALERFSFAKWNAAMGAKARAWEEYGGGIRSLVEARDLLVSHPSAAELRVSRKGGQLYPNLRWPEGLPEETTMRGAVEATCCQYAPWGLDLVRCLMDHGALTESFDLRVVPGIGEQLYTDVMIADVGQACGVPGPWKDFGDEVLKNLFAAGQSGRRVFLRVYSPRMLEPSAIQKTARWVELGTRWGGAAYGLWACATATTGGAASLLPLGFAALDTGLEWMAENEDGSAYVTAGHVSTGGSWVSTLVTLESKKDAVTAAGQTLSIRKLWGDLKPTSKGSLFFMFADMGAKAVLATTKDKEAQRIQALSKAMRGYRSAPAGYLSGWFSKPSNVPPLMMMVTVAGRYRQGAVYKTETGPLTVVKDAYPVTGERSETWLLDYRYVYPESTVSGGLSSSLDRLIEIHKSDAAEIIMGKYPDLERWPLGEKDAAALAAWKALPGFRPELVLETHPHEQFIAFALSRELLERICELKQVPKSNWSTVELSDIRAKIFPRGGDAKRIGALTMPQPLVSLPLKHSEQKPGPKRRFFAVHLVAAGCQASTALESLDPNCRGGAIGLLPGRPLAQYTLAIVRIADGRDRRLATFKLNFLNPQMARIVFGQREVTGRWYGSTVEKVPWQTLWALGEENILPEKEVLLEMDLPRDPKDLVKKGVPSFLFRIYARNISSGHQRLKAQFDDGRNFYFWAYIPNRFSGDWGSLRFYGPLPAYPGQMQVTFSMPDMPEVKPITLSGVCGWHNKKNSSVEYQLKKLLARIGTRKRLLSQKNQKPEYVKHVQMWVGEDYWKMGEQYRSGGRFKKALATCATAEEWLKKTGVQPAAGPKGKYNLPYRATRLQNNIQSLRYRLAFQFDDAVTFEQLGVAQAERYLASAKDGYSRAASAQYRILAKELPMLTGEIRFFRNYILKSIECDPQARTPEAKKKRFEHWKTSGGLGWALEEYQDKKDE